MPSQVLQLFKQLKCPVHQEQYIVQVCISSQCPQSNRLCCLECVDEHHVGPDHTLISHFKFNTLMDEFHVLLKEKQLLNEKLLGGLKSQQTDISNKINLYYKFIEESLTKQNELIQYEGISQIDPKTLKSEEVLTKLNQLVDNHSWMLEINCRNIPSSQQQQQKNAKVIHSLRSKYVRLQKQLNEINSTCEEQITQILKRRTAEIKKLFHLFDEIKYNLQDEGKQLEQLTYSVTKVNIEDLSMKQYKGDEAEKKKVKSVFDFMGNIAGQE